MKIATVIGARPQFIKASAISRCIKEDYASEIQEILVHTGQHYDEGMSDVFFSELEIPTPHYNLGIGGGTHGANTGRMIEGIEKILLKDKFEWLFVYGDTDSTLAGAIAASKLGVPVMHIEAGLRSFNRAMPEEINRVLTDHISNLLFTPTAEASKNLLSEGISIAKIKQAGDVMQDVALFYQNKATEIPNLMINESFIVFTLHRKENTSDIKKLSNIISALNTIARDIPVIMPVHPRTKKCFAAAHLDTSYLTLIDPVSYLQMLWLLKHCNLVVTDSGGLQKEAFFMGKPCVTTRHETEWVELVESGVNCLAGTNVDEIVSSIYKMYSAPVMDNQMLYGGGGAASRIMAMALYEGIHHCGNSCL